MQGVQIINGHALDVLRSMPAESVHCFVSSWPYWGLRDYNLEPQVWGGETGCPHQWGAWSEIKDVREETTSAKSRTSDRFYGDDPTRKFNGNHQKHTSGAFCSLCGAWRGSFGLEPTP